MRGRRWKATNIIRWPHHREIIERIISGELKKLGTRNEAKANDFIEVIMAHPTGHDGVFGAAEPNALRVIVRVNSFEKGEGASPNFIHDRKDTQRRVTGPANSSTSLTVPSIIQAENVTGWRVSHRTVVYGHLYRGWFKGFPVQSDDKLPNLSRYVERNPLSAGWSIKRNCGGGAACGRERAARRRSKHCYRLGQRNGRRTGRLASMLL